MERWRKDDPCAGVRELAQSIESGLWLNLLVTDLTAAVYFQTTILEAEVAYQDDQFAIMQHGRSFWMLHADQTYAGHPMKPALRPGEARGIGCEIRLQNCDPAPAEARALQHGFRVLAVTQDKPHGLRETYLLDQDGYVWVPSVAQHEGAPATA